MAIMDPGDIRDIVRWDVQKNSSRSLRIPERAPYGRPGVWWVDAIVDRTADFILEQEFRTLPFVSRESWWKVLDGMAYENPAPSLTPGDEVTYVFRVGIEKDPLGTITVTATLKETGELEFTQMEYTPVGMPWNKTRSQKSKDFPITLVARSRLIDLED